MTVEAGAPGGDARLLGALAAAASAASHRRALVAAVGEVLAREPGVARVLTEALKRRAPLSRAELALEGVARQGRGGDARPARASAAGEDQPESAHDLGRSRQLL